MANPTDAGENYRLGRFALDSAIWLKTIRPANAARRRAADDGDRADGDIAPIGAVSPSPPRSQIDLPLDSSRKRAC